MSQDIKDFLNAEPVTVNNFFTSGVLFQVPPYQREYSWTKNEVQELFDDIMGIENNETYFIGSIILLKMNNADHLEIIDGQQRSTTISLAYISLYYLSNYLQSLATKLGNDNLKSNLSVLVSELKKCLVKDGNNILTLSEQKNNKNDYMSAVKYSPTYDKVENLTKTVDTYLSGIDKRRKLYKNFLFLFDEIKTTILDSFIKDWNSKHNSTYMKAIDPKWSSKTESLLFQYISKDDFSELDKHVKSILKDGTDTKNPIYNQFIGSLTGNILSFIKSIEFDKEKVTAMDGILQNFDAYTNNEIAENCSALLGKNPEEILQNLDISEYVKDGIRGNIISMRDEIEKANKEIVEQHISPVIEAFLLKYVDEIKKIKQKIDNTALVKMIVKNPSSANNLFETINHRGMPLSAMDLIKNDILRSIAQEDQLKSENDRKLALAIEYWNSLIEDIESSDDQIRFLRHFYITEYFTEKSFKNPTKSNIVDLFKEKLDNADNKFDFFNKVINDSKIYLFMTNFEKDSNGNYKFNIFGNEIKTYFEDLNKLNTKPAFILFLWLLKWNILDIQDIYKYIKIFFLKRHITNVPEVKYLDGFFTEIIKKMSENTQLNKLNIIKEVLEDKHPSKELLRERLSGPIYDTNSEVTRYLLIELNTLLSPASQQETINLWDKNKKNDYIFTIEHIVPQNEDIEDKWSGQKTNILEWQNILLSKNLSNTLFSVDDKKFVKENHMKYVHMLGNLTLTAYNASLSDANFINKRDAKDTKNKYTGFKNDLSLNSKLKFEVESVEECIATLENFRIEEIIARGEVMIEKLLKDILLVTN